VSKVFKPAELASVLRRCFSHFMVKKLQFITMVAMSWLCLSMQASAQTSDAVADDHKLASILWSMGPVVVIAVIFWFVFVRTIKKQQKSPLVLRQQAYLARHEQHMERMEQLMERIAKALEKDKS